MGKRSGSAGIFLSMCALADAPFSVGFVTSGMVNGYFMWPFNFDPVWLTSCDAYRGKDEK